MASVSVLRPATSLSADNIVIEQANARRARYRLVIGVVAAILVILASVVLGHRDISAAVRSNYRCRGAAGVLVDYMMTKNRWPHDGSDLEGFMGAKTVAGLGNFNELKAHFDIDFSFELPATDTREDHDEKSAPNQLIKLRRGAPIFLSTNDPNEIVLRYIASRRKPSIKRSN